MILAQLAAGSYDLIHLLIIAMVIAGIIGIALIVIRQSGMVIPGWVMQILGIILLVVVGVIAIRFLAGLL